MAQSMLVATVTDSQLMNTLGLLRTPAYRHYNMTSTKQAIGTGTQPGSKNAWCQVAEGTGILGFLTDTCHKTFENKMMTMRRSPGLNSHTNLYTLYYS